MVQEQKQWHGWRVKGWQKEIKVGVDGEGNKRSHGDMEGLEELRKDGK